MVVTMNGAECAAAIAAMRWSNRRIAQELGCTETLVQWCLDRYPVPPLVAEWLRKCAHASRVTLPPAPKRWRVNPNYK